MNVRTQITIACAWLVLLSVGDVAASSSNGSWRHDPRSARNVAVPILDWSLRWIPFLRPDPGVPIESDGIVLARTDDYHLVGFEVRDQGLGVYLDVRGKVAFDRAEVVFEDGELQAIDLGGVERGVGLYELASFDASRPVLGVRMHARAVSRQARLTLLLGR